jgi:hypothetical protein
MLGSLKCTSVLKDMGMSPLLLSCMFLNMVLLPLQTGSSEQTTKFLYAYFHFHMKLQYKDLTSLAGIILI